MKRVIVFLMVTITMLFFMVSCFHQSEKAKENIQTIAPTTPEPVDGAKNVNINHLCLKWKGSIGSEGDIISYDVYFGESQNSMKLVYKDLDKTSVNIPELEKSKTYYWKVVAKNRKGEEISSKVWSFTTEKKMIQNGYMFVYGDGMLAIYDVNSDPEHPVFVSSIDLPHESTSFCFDGVYLYTEDLDIIDLSDVKNPELIEKHDGAYMPSDARDIVVTNGYAYIATFDKLEIVDISDKTNPKKIGMYNTGYVYGVYVDGNYAYLAAGISGLEIVDISDKANPKKVGNYDTGTAYGVYIDGNYAYVADYDNGLVIVDITNKTNPIKVTSVSTNGSAYEIIGIKIYGVQKNIFLGTEGGLKAVDITDLNKAYLIDSYFDDFSVHHGVISGDYAYVTGDGYAVVDISNQYSFDKPIYEYVDKYSNPSAYSGVHVDDYDIIAAGDSGLAIYNETTRKTYTLYLEGTARDVFVDDNYAYVANYYHGLEIVDISDKTNPKKVGDYDPGYFYSVEGVYVEGNYAYLAAGDSGLVIVDISDKTKPKKVGNYNNFTKVYGVYVDGDYAYIAGFDKGLVIVDISDKTNPRKIGEYNTTGLGFAIGIYVDGDYAYVANSYKGLEIVDISDKTNPVKVGAYSPGYFYNVEKVYVDGNYAYLAAGNSEFVIVDISDKTNPTKIAAYDTKNISEITSPVKIKNYDYGYIYDVKFDSNNNVVYVAGSMGYMQINVLKPDSVRINWKIPMSDFGAILIW
ncbi:hypothetical protein [Marinitoga sp. 1138]|uniref:fibronectin type III domain-containing protein n=1 Tax=Marinitoga sp. 1138 TaxID=1643334 RepID=UPI0015863E2C|nr:hypothetical protein [Marinitoga sp. 1138]NUU98501.1 hypothetical protein [Marinitoga sp. 1138]